MEYLKDYYDPSTEQSNVSVWELIYMILFSPTKGFNYINSHENNFALYIIFAIGVVSSGVGYLTTLSVYGMPIDNAWVILMVMLFAAMMIMLTTAVYHLIAELFAKRGSAVSMLAVVSLAQLPYFFSVFLYGFGLLGSFAASVATLLYLGIMIWSFLIILKGITVLYELSNLKAIFIISLPALVIMGMFLVVIIAVFSYMSMFVGDMMGEIMASPALME